MAARKPTRKSVKRTHVLDRDIYASIDGEIARTTRAYGKPPNTFVRVARVALALSDALGDSDIYVGAVKDGVYTVTLSDQFGFTLITDGRHAVWGEGVDGDWLGEIKGGEATVIDEIINHYRA